MSKKIIYEFLRDLSENNSKEWMHANKSYYHRAKERWLQEVEVLLHRLAKYDSRFEKVPPKKCIFRITNNRQFHKDRPLYRDNFGFAPVEDMYEPSIYVFVSPKETFVGGGLHKPPSKNLKKVREGIDYDGEKLREIIEGKDFKEFFGGLDHYDDHLKTGPRGYDYEHRNIDLLCYKSFTVRHPVSRKEFLSNDFVDIVEKAYLLLRPMNEYLHQAISFEN